MRPKFSKLNHHRRRCTRLVVLIVLLLSVVPSQVSGASAATQPLFPIRAAFFYPWFPHAWNQNRTFPFTNFHPSLGYYDSQTDAIIDSQLRLAAQGHLDAFIGSWWGQGDLTDLALKHILERSGRSGSPDPALRWAIYYEPEGQGDPPTTQIVSDMRYLASTLFAQPAYLRVNDTPVVFVYADANDAANMASRWAQAKAQLGGHLYVVLKVYSNFRLDANQPDSWHQYGPAAAYDEQLPYSATVSPGFWKKGEQPRLGRDPARFDANVRKMAASGADWQLVTTWNEWGEGTAVEPASEYRTTYISILCRNLPGLKAC